MAFNEALMKSFLYPFPLPRMLDDVRKSRGTMSELPTAARLEGVLDSISEELKDCPFYYVLHELFSCLHSEIPTMAEMTSAIRNAGYESSRFHNEPSAIKTNAPNYVVWDIMRAYCRLNPPKGSAKKKPSDSSIAILSKVSRTVVSFKFAHPARRARGKYYMNPEPSWGPGKKGKRDWSGNTWDIPAVTAVDEATVQSVIAIDETAALEEPILTTVSGAEDEGKVEVHAIPSCSDEDRAIPLPSHSAQEANSGDHIGLSREVMKDASSGEVGYGIAKKK